MDSKKRFTFIFVLISLTMTMLFFQNCSPSGGLYSGDSNDPLLIDPPVIFAAKNSACTQISTAFKTNEVIYICIQKAGTAPIYCHEYSTSTTCVRNVVSTANSWSAMSGGNWVRGFSTASGTGFPVGTFTSYVERSDDPLAVSNTTFTVTVP
ncbi:MAG: hypothetical protein V4596_01080 [Bdellovibrionota bacterium]